MIPSVVNVVLAKKNTGPAYVARLSGAYTQAPTVMGKAPTVRKGAAIMPPAPWPPKKDQGSLT